MSTLQDIKATIDTNHDNKLSLDELEKARTEQNSDTINLLQAKARRYDGKVDIKSLGNTIVKI
jgi:hypothetical protein